MNRLVAALAALTFLGGVAACSLNTGPLTADEWAWCQSHWREGLESSQRDQPYAGTWFFNHMGMRDDPDTIRVCRKASANR